MPPNVTMFCTTGSKKRWNGSGWRNDAAATRTNWGGDAADRDRSALATGDPSPFGRSTRDRRLDFRTGVQILEVLEEQAQAGMTIWS